MYSNIMHFYQHGKRIRQKCYTKFLLSSMKISLHDVSRMYYNTENFVHCWGKYILDEGSDKLCSHVKERHASGIKCIVVILYCANFTI